MSFSSDLMKYISKSNLFRNFPLGLTTSFPKRETLADNNKNNKIESEIISNKLQFISQDWKGIESSRIKRLKKLDINEEIIRLKNHLKFFISEINSEYAQGKKLSFISQEIGREINTIGSKANNFKIQSMVVNMKEENEKIKQNIFNIA